MKPGTFSNYVVGMELPNGKAARSWTSSSSLISFLVFVSLNSCFFPVDAIKCKCDICNNQTCEVDGGVCFTSVQEKSKS